VIPTALAGLIGIYLSLQTLRNETLRNLNQEVTVRAQRIGGFFDQLSSELLFLADSSVLADVAAARLSGDAPVLRDAADRLRADYSALATRYAHIFQVRLIAADGREWVRVDRRPDGVHVVPTSELQSKADRYYFRDAIRMVPGQIYVSPLDLNVEFGKVEQPARPVIRFATPVAGPDGRTFGLLVINLRAEIVLEQIRQMASARNATAYLFDNQRQFVSRSAGGRSVDLVMEPIAKLDKVFSARILSSLVGNGASPVVDDGWIVAHAPVDFAMPVHADDRRVRWRVALASQERELLLAVTNLYLLYAVLSAALLVTAVGGYAVSRRLLRPLDELSRETDAIAEGDYARKVNVSGNDEISALGEKFNRMAERLHASSRTINAHRANLEHEIHARTLELEQERASLEAVIEHTADGILAIDMQGVIRLLNQAAAHLLGDRPDLPGTEIGRVWPWWPELAADVVAGARRREMAVGEQLLSLAITRTTNGYVVVARDISRERAIHDERRELDRQMYQTEKLTTLGELAMGMAHEIGNPLAGMKAVAQALQYEEDVPTFMVDALARLESEVDRLSGFLHSFHGFAAPPNVTMVPCNLTQILDDVLFWTRKDAKSQNIRITLDGIAGVPDLLADPHQLKQVLLNLVMNAVHAMPGGGMVTITARPEGPAAMVEVCDTGSVIEARLLTRIFEPFFTTRLDGTGLGLAIVLKIITQHGGTIDVRSTLGRGSCFLMTWPLAETPHA